MIGTFISGVNSIVVFIIVLSLLIIVHEWGHFITAKRLGIEVQRFALGFGPTLYSKFYKGTNYMINIIPLGGYVKMAGDERSECKGKEGEFYSKPVSHRALVVLNGPVVNFIMAYISFIFVFMIGYPGHSATVTELSIGGPAQIAGIQSGDKIIAIDSKKIYGWFNLEEKLIGTRSDPIDVTVLRNEHELKFEVLPNVMVKPNLVGRPRMVRDLGVDNLPNIIGGLVEGYPAQNSGLEQGDKIIKVDSKDVTSWVGLQNAITGSDGDKIKIKYLRNGKPFETSIIPKIDIYTDKNGVEQSKRKIGIGPEQELDLYQFGIINSLAFAGEELWFITRLTYESLFRMVTGAISAKESMTGPVGIFYIVKGAAESGISHLLFIFGVISASLAIFNLLPIIPLDGGHLLLFGIEKVRGKALSSKMDEYIARAGFSLIILLAMFVFYSDFVRFGWIEGISNWFGQIKNLFP